MLKGIKESIKKQLDYQKEYKELLESSEQRFRESDRMRRSETYIKYCESTKVDKNIILYESFWGRGMSDSPFALFKVLLRDERFAGAKHVWVVDDLERHDPKAERYKKYNIEFVERLSDEYLKYLATAGLLINNVTFPPVFNKRPGQLYINTWHGTPLKKMGYSMAGGSFGSRYVLRNFLHTDFFIAPNDILEDMYLKDYKMEGIIPGKIIKEGYPRIDLIFNTDRDSLLDELSYYGVDVERDKQIILYAPTWKQNDRQDVLVDIDELIAFKETLESQIDTDKYQVLVKPHQKLYEEVKDDEKYKGKIIPPYIDANEILSATDILISDYSSIFFDFMAIDRPILFYITDLEEYSTSRGLNMDIESLPGPVSDKIEDVATWIGSIDKVEAQYSQRYEDMKKKICPYDDGRSAERIVDCITGNEEKYNIVRSDSAKKKILIALGPLKENGIIDPAFDLLRSFDHEEFDVTLYVAVDKANDELISRVSEDIDPHVRVLLKTGNRAETSKEAADRVLCERNAADDPGLLKRFPAESMRREFKRTFGGAGFDYVADLNGSNMYNAQLVLQSGDARKSIWIRNAIPAEGKSAKGKRPSRSLKYCMTLYPQYDAIVAGSREEMEICRKRFATAETTEKFTWAKDADGNDNEAYIEFIRAVTGQ